MGILEQLEQEECWQEFLTYKIERQHRSKKEKEKIEEYIEKKAYLPILKEMRKVIIFSNS